MNGCGAARRSGRHPARNTDRPAGGGGGPSRSSRHARHVTPPPPCCRRRTGGLLSLLTRHIRVISTGPTAGSGVFRSARGAGCRRAPPRRTHPRQTVCRHNTDPYRDPSTAACPEAAVTGARRPEPQQQLTFVYYLYTSR